MTIFSLNGTTIWEDKSSQMKLNVTIFSINGTTNSESEGAPFILIRYDDLGG